MKIEEEDSDDKFTSNGSIAEATDNEMEQATHNKIIDQVNGYGVHIYSTRKVMLLIIL